MLAVAGTIFGCEPSARSTPVGTAPPPPPPAGAGISFAQTPVAVEDRVAINEGVAVGIATDHGDATFDSQGSLRDPQPPAGEQTPRTEPTTVAPARESPPAIQLSAGVALPQLLPEGTQIGVSVDYRVRGELNGSASYFLVVSSSEGEIAFPVEVSASGGTLQGFCPPSVRPEHKPFTARIEEQSPASRSRTTISNRAMLATSY
jgi:hypothetical protein